MRLTLTVRTKLGNATTVIQEFTGEHVNERMLVALTALVNSWVIRDECEIIVLTVTTSVPNVAQGD